MQYNLQYDIMSQVEGEVRRIRCDIMSTNDQYLQNRAEGAQSHEVKLNWYVMRTSSTYILTVEDKSRLCNGMANKKMTEMKIEV